MNPLKKIPDESMRCSSLNQITFNIYPMQVTSRNKKDLKINYTWIPLES